MGIFALRDIPAGTELSCTFPLSFALAILWYTDASTQTIMDGRISGESLAPPTEQLSKLELIHIANDATVEPGFARAGWAGRRRRLRRRRSTRRSQNPTGENQPKRSRRRVRKLSQNLRQRLAKVLFRKPVQSSKWSGSSSKPRSSRRWL